MDLVFNQVDELQYVSVPDSHGLIKRLTCAPVEELHLACLRQVSTAQELLDVLFRGPIKDGRGDLQAQPAGSPAEVRLHDLPYVHAVGDA